MWHLAPPRARRYWLHREYTLKAHNKHYRCVYFIYFMLNMLESLRVGLGVNSALKLRMGSIKFCLLSPVGIRAMWPQPHQPHGWSGPGRHTDKQTHKRQFNQHIFITSLVKVTSSSAIAERPRCRVGYLCQRWKTGTGRQYLRTI